jgi:hypothetical protein
VVGVTSLKSTMRTVASEVMGALTAANRPKIERHHVIVGQSVWDVPCGQLTVAPERQYRYRSFPIEDTNAEACDTDEIAVVTVVRLLRCVPTLTNAGKPPRQEASEDAYESIMDDAQVIWNALLDPDWCPYWERSGLAQQFLGDLGGAVECETRFVLGTGLTRWS